MDTTLEEAVQEVRKCRLDITEIENTIDALSAQLAQLEVFRKLEDAKAQLRYAKIQRDVLEDTLRAVAVKEYLASGDKKPYQGVEIEMFNVTKVTDAHAAILWVAKNVTNPDKYLKFDEQKFTADVGFELPFVERSEEPRAQLSSKL